MLRCFAALIASLFCVVLVVACSGNKGGGPSASSASSTYTYPKSLNEEEKALAKQYGIPLEALELIKERTGSKVFEVEMRYSRPWLVSGAFPTPDFGWNEVNLRKLRAIIKQYPELKPVIMNQIKDRFKFDDESWVEGIADYKAAFSDDLEQIEYARKLKEFVPYAILEHRRKSSDSVETAIAPAYLDEKVPARQIYNDLKKRYSGWTLGEEFKPIKVLGFFLPEDSTEDLLRVESVLLRRLQKKLEPMGFVAYGANNYQAPSRTVEGGKTKVRQILYQQSKNRRKVVTFDPEKYDPKNPRTAARGFFISPGTAVKKLSSTEWELTESSPELQLEPEAEKSLVVLSRELDPIRFVQLVGSNGQNNLVSNDSLVEKLRRWDTAYGIDLVRANSDTVEFRCKRLPDDLSPFLTEIFLICPDTIQLSPNMRASAVAMKEYAQGLRMGRSIVLWWD